jgi:hypothetical protein
LVATAVQLALAAGKWIECHEIIAFMPSPFRYPLSMEKLFTYCCSMSLPRQFLFREFAQPEGALFVI